MFMLLAVQDFGPLPTSAVRVAVAAASLLPLVYLRGLWPQLRANWKPLLLIGVFNSGIPFACFAFALMSITTGLSAILNATVPLFGALVAWVWLKDRPNASRVLGLAIGFAGVALLTWDQASFRPSSGGIAPAWAVLACLVATLCYALAANASKLYLGGLHSLVTAAGSCLGAALGLALPAIWLWPAHMPGLQAWASVTVAGVVCSGIAYVLYFRLIEKTGPARTVAVTFLIPLFALLYGTLFLGEAVTARMLWCGLVVLLGTALSTGLLTLPGGRRNSSRH